MFLNILLLLAVAFLPFPTRLVADYLQKDGEQAAVYAYDATFVVMAIVYNLWWRYASSGPPADRARTSPSCACSAITRAFNPGVPTYAADFRRRLVQPARQRRPHVRVAAFYLPSAALFER